MCTFQDTIEMYRAPHEADDISTSVPDSRGTLSRHMFGARYSYNTASCGWRAVRANHKTVPSPASPSYSEPFQVLCRFPDLLNRTIYILFISLDSLISLFMTYNRNIMDKGQNHREHISATMAPVVYP